jgi:uncharacterized membrane-anchored protein
MGNNLKIIVQEMIESGYTEQEIAIEIKKYQTQTQLVKERFLKSKTRSNEEAPRPIDKNKLLQKIADSKILIFILELVLPIILTSLFYLLVDSKDLYGYDVEDEYIITLVSFLFFFILFIEWLRRKKDTTNRPTYFKYVYIIVMFFVFIFSVWYINQFE